MSNCASLSVLAFSNPALTGICQRPTASVNDVVDLQDGYVASPSALQGQSIAAAMTRTMREKACRYI
ncbi:hypothetical protein ColLi_09236 [Colletotrichum liriopes]|uniref:Uncharacterized protein n=1 Tax=Colletotrichum liriopes TaxID=708192 RepID=A0AA37LWC4_9PEZI|nr:hypothetical protein ColLi_09236 [Colletotrichum liriopes]